MKGEMTGAGIGSAKNGENMKSEIGLADIEAWRREDDDVEDVNAPIAGEETLDQLVLMNHLSKFKTLIAQVNVYAEAVHAVPIVPFVSEGGLMASYVFFGGELFGLWVWVAWVAWVAWKILRKGEESWKRVKKKENY